MSDLDRRQFLKSVLGALAAGAGGVVLASTSAKASRAAKADSLNDKAPPKDLQHRADQLAMNWNRSEVNAEVEANEFLNVGWNPGFRNGGWPNGGWRNGGWGNGGWRNGGWPNSVWRNGGWRNGNWRNGGWLNAGRRRR